MTHDEAVKVLKRYAKKLVRFHESSNLTERDHLVVGFIYPGSFGIGDDFFDAMRSLRRRPSRANKVKP